MLKKNSNIYEIYAHGLEIYGTNILDDYIITLGQKIQYDGR